MADNKAYNHDNVAFRQFVYHTLLGIKQEIAALNDLDPANIKLGSKILGYTGTFTGTDVANAATALDIAEGKIAYVNGVEIVGLAGITEYALTVGTGGDGTGSVTVDGNAYVAPVDYVAGSEVELVATPNAGSVFVNWTVSDVEVSKDATYTYTMPKTAKTIVANFDLG
jgi:hypothetical protein